MNTATTIAIIVAILAFAVVGFLLIERRRSYRLRNRFGPEYERAVEQEGSFRRGEAALEKREKRVSNYRVHPLTRDEKERYLNEWKKTQEYFVDDPREAVSRADRLVTQVMTTRGYPMTDFEEQAADLSVDHPHVVREYRAGHEIAMRSDQGQASTEDLRVAMQHYRTLFDEIVENRGIREEVHRS